TTGGSSWPRPTTTATPGACSWTPPGAAAGSCWSPGRPTPTGPSPRPGGTAGSDPEVSMPSPTSRTLQLLRSEGFTAAVVERWVPGRPVRIDLFGAFDLVAVKADVAGVLGVQTTSGTNHASRVTKFRENPHLRVWLAAGNRAEVWSWAQRGGRWQV